MRRSSPRPRPAATACAGRVGSCVQVRPPRTGGVAQAPATASAGAASPLSAGTNWLALKTAPCGSAMTVIRTNRASNGAATTRPPRL
jgi:hypothetical protein